MFVEVSVCLEWHKYMLRAIGLCDVIDRVHHTNDVKSNFLLFIDSTINVMQSIWNAFQGNTSLIRYFMCVLWSLNSYILYLYSIYLIESFSQLTYLKRCLENKKNQICSWNRRICRSCWACVVIFEIPFILSLMFDISSNLCYL